jgi:hypothetical protein
MKERERERKRFSRVMMKQKQQRHANVRLLVNQFYADVIKGTTKSTFSCQEQVKKV